jgi:hypothetical protein
VGRHILAPHNVREFIRAFDRQPPTDEGHLDTDQVECYYCEELFDPEELDDEGVCEEFRKEKET